MSQCEVLEMIDQYNSTDRKIIKENLKKIMTYHNIKWNDITELGYSKCLVDSWINRANKNIPMFDHALRIAIRFNFDIKEFVKN